MLEVAEMMEVLEVTPEVVKAAMTEVVEVKAAAMEVVEVTARSL